jgi:hypothetical protein
MNFKNLTTGGKKGIDFSFDKKIFGGSLFWHAIETVLQEHSRKSYAKNTLCLKNCFERMN